MGGRLQYGGIMATPFVACTATNGQLVFTHVDHGSMMRLDAVSLYRGQLLPIYANFLDRLEWVGKWVFSHLQVFACVSQLVVVGRNARNLVVVCFGGGLARSVPADVSKWFTRKYVFTAVIYFTSTYKYLQPPGAPADLAGWQHTRLLTEVLTRVR